jgi:probable HAF family extracellular repeat protein
MSLKLAFGAIAASMLISSAAEATVYTLTVLGTNGPAGNSGSYADGINNVGQVVGGVTGPDGNFHAAVFNLATGAIVDLGTLGGPSSGANAINDLGQVVGQSDLNSSGNSGAFFYDTKVGGALTNLGTIPVGTAFQTGAANAINNAGVIVGIGTNTLNEGRAVEYYANGTAPTDLGLADPSQGSTANAVSNNGSIAGDSFVNGTTPAMHAATFNNGGVQFENNLTTNVGNSSFINGINDLGVATGYGQVGVYGNNHAFVFTNGNVTDIGTLGGPNGNGYAYGQAINDAGTVVGYSQFTDANGNYDTDGFVYANGVMQDLNSSLAPGTADPFMSLSYALGINNAGQIVGYGELADGEYRGFVLTAAVPEPASAAMLAVGGLLALPGRRRAAARRAPR